MTQPTEQFSHRIHGLKSPTLCNLRINETVAAHGVGKRGGFYV